MKTGSPVNHKARAPSFHRAVLLLAADGWST
jgi:hypothetical protein